MRLYDWMMRHLNCCGCGCVIGPSIALAAIGGGGLGAWAVLS